MQLIETAAGAPDQTDHNNGRRQKMIVQQNQCRNIQNHTKHNADGQLHSVKTKCRALALRSPESFAACPVTYGRKWAG